MTTLLQRLNILSWPIWVKLLAGFILAILLPLALVVIVAQASLREISLQNLEAYISENGTRQALAIANSINQSHMMLETFLNDAGHNRRLTGLLLSRNPAFAGDAILPGDAREVSSALREVLLNPATTIFEAVYLLDRRGVVAAQATTGVAATAVGGPANNQSAIYNALVSASISGQTRAITVSLFAGVDPLIQIGYPVYWRDGTVLGYLVADLNESLVIYDQLNFAVADYPAYSFLRTTSGIFMVPAETRRLTTVERDSPAVDRALLGETGTARYTPQGGEEVVGYFTRITDTPMVLVVEAPARAAIVQTSGLDSRLFVAGVGLLALIGALVAFFNQLIAPPLERLQRVAEGVREGDFSTPILDAGRDDEIGQLAASIMSMRDHVQSLVRDLEARVEARTRDINATQEIGRFAVTQRDLQEMMNQVVNLIVERFESIYHAQIFLIDAERKYAVLRASTGDPGEKLLARGHRLAVGSISVIGQVTERGQIVHARDTAASTVHKRNEFLPDTRAELAIPLRMADSIIGALDVQSKQRDAFTIDLINVLQTMADQIAVAIQNARLYEESIQRLEQIEQNNRLSTLRAWQEYMRTLREQAFSSEAGTATGLDTSALRREAMEYGEIAIGELTERRTIPIAVPLQLRGQTLGAVEWELPVQDLDQNTLLLAQELANRLAISLDNARLFQESQLATERERVVNNIAARLTSQTSIDNILQTAVREVGQALRAPHVSLRLRGAGNGVSSANGVNGQHHDDEA